MATRNIVPRGDGEGSIGRVNKKWESVYAGKIVDRASILSYGAKGDGVTDDSTALQAALTAIGGTDSTLHFPAGTYILGADIIIPSNVCLKFEKGAIISVSDTYTLTINGPIEAGLWHIFDGDGTVTGSPKIKAVYPEWFGAKGDGVQGAPTDAWSGTDDHAVIMKAINFAYPVGLPIQFRAAVYCINNTLDMPLSGSDNSHPIFLLGSESNYYGRGTERGTTFWFPLSVENGINWADPTGGATRRVGSINMHHIHLRKQLPSTFNSDTYVFNGDTPVGVGLGGSSSVWLLNCKVENCSFSGWGFGIRCGYAYYSTFQKLTFNWNDVCMYHSGLNGTAVSECIFHQSIEGVNEFYSSVKNIYRGCWFEGLSVGLKSSYGRLSYLDSCYFENINLHAIRSTSSVIAVACSFSVYMADKHIYMTRLGDVSYREPNLVMIGCTIVCDKNFDVNIYQYCSVTLISNTYTSSGVEPIDVSFSGGTPILIRLNDANGTITTLSPEISGKTSLSHYGSLSHRVTGSSNTIFTKNTNYKALLTSEFRYVCSVVVDYVIRQSFDGTLIRGQRRISWSAGQSAIIEGPIYTQVFVEGSAAGTIGSPSAVFTIEKDSETNQVFLKLSYAGEDSSKNSIKVECLSDQPYRLVDGLVWEIDS